MLYYPLNKVGSALGSAVGKVLVERRLDRGKGIRVGPQCLSQVSM